MLLPAGSGSSRSSIAVDDTDGSLNADRPSSGSPRNLCVSGTIDCPSTLSRTYPTHYTSGSYGDDGVDIPISNNQHYDVTMSSSAPDGLEYSGCVVTVTSTTPNEVSTFVFYTNVD
jgi:hypothetical protein